MSNSRSAQLRLKAPAGLFDSTSMTDERFEAIVLGVLRRQFTWNPASWNRKPKRDDLALQERILGQVPLPGESFVLVLNHRDKRDWGVFKGVADAEILRR
jgi:hypothetical protein